MSIALTSIFGNEVSNNISTCFSHDYQIPFLETCQKNVIEKLSRASKKTLHWQLFGFDTLVITPAQYRYTALSETKFSGTRIRKLAIPKLLESKHLMIYFPPYIF